MPWGLIVGGALSYLGSKKASDSYSDAANNGAKATEFKPYNVYSGYGSGTFSPATAGTAGTPGRWSGGGYNGSGGVTQQGNSSYYSGSNPGTWIPDTAGTSGTPASATSTLNPRYQSLRDQYLDQASGWNGALTDYDPDSAAAGLYEKLRAISEPQRQSDRNAFETRLLAQGQMGLQQGGVNPLSQSFRTSENTADLQRELSAFGLAQDVQDRLLSRSLQSTNAAVGIDGLPLEQLSLGGVFGGRGAQASQFGAGLQNNAAMRAGDATSQLWSSIGQQVAPAINNWMKPSYNDQRNAFSGSMYSPTYGGGAYGGSSAWAP